MFVDKVLVSIKAGDGGNGVISFRREKFRERGGPDGGDGGDGGDVILRASRNQNTLAAFRYKKLIKAPSGLPGSRTKRHGRSGQNLEVQVPVGTTVVDEVGTTLADLTYDEQSATIVRGGKGGFGNAHFVSSTRQAPKVVEKGEKGETIDAVLELKMIADVGVVGLPNAGKSTLLARISNAKPEIASYPFTTLHPNLGVADVDSKNSLLFADIPGLIEGASWGRGLGDEFLRHVERTSVLVHLIDIYSDDIASAYKTIMTELRDYTVDLSKRSQVVVLNKTEGFDPKDLLGQLKKLKKVVPRGTPVLAISAASGEGVKELLRTVDKQVKQARQRIAKKTSKPKLPIIGLKTKDDNWRVVKQGGSFIVSGKKIERFAARTHLDDYYGQQRLRDIMGKMGILGELERQGIEAGQTIIIGHPPIGEVEY